MANKPKSPSLFASAKSFIFTGRQKVHRSPTKEIQSSQAVLQPPSPTAHSATIIPGVKLYLPSALEPQDQDFPEQQEQTFNQPLAPNHAPLYNLDVPQPSPPTNPDLTLQSAPSSISCDMMRGTAEAGVVNRLSIGLSAHQLIQNDIAEDHLYQCQKQLQLLGEELMMHLRLGNTVNITKLEKTVKALQDGSVQLRLRRAEAEDAG
ncbi:hypothetical protein PILCRDRAFT_4803 [Piloderma croceum F 1598]|uniref:Uncharacterized protein n=1 Tax=Piloderma croceum (strain F 1598) TaxID=765440 RepID=A0A0C3BIZ4_PILCF|nr:hypothetical protein PILCRDRAFT_16409 [Piloderma croceum F 1598]KIM86288.1 hypothetical protein PILCRDRAFT_4803 [Piloderma croceum F 1598]